MKKSVLRSYARLIARSGVNIQPQLFSIYIDISPLFIYSGLAVCGMPNFNEKYRPDQALGEYREKRRKNLFYERGRINVQRVDSPAESLHGV